MKNYNSQKGQALITLLFFMIIGVTVISAAIAILFVNIQATTATEVSQKAYYFAESGVEDAILRLLRNPNFNTDSTGAYQALPPASGNASVTVSSGGIIVSTGVSGSTVRKIQVQTSYTNGQRTYSDWKEVN